MRMQTKSYAPSGHYSAKSIAFSRYSLAMLASGSRPPQQLRQLGDVGGDVFKALIVHGRVIERPMERAHEVGAS